MSKIRVGGINGNIYEMPENFTFREMRLIKRMTGHPAGKVFDAAAEGDTDVIAAFALVAMMRENKTLTEDSVLDLTIDQIEFLPEEEEEEDRPPEAPAATPGPEPDDAS